MTTGYSSFLLEFAEGQDPFNTNPLTWTDRSTWLRTASTKRGREGQFDLFAPGTASIKLATSFDNTPYPMTPVRLSAVDSGNTRRNIFTGFVRPGATPIDWTATADGTFTEVTIQCEDNLAVMARHNLPELDVPAYGDRAAALLTSVALQESLAGTPFLPLWGSASFDTGQTIMQDTPLGMNALALFQLVAQSEGGWCFCDRDGNTVFLDRYSVFNTSRCATSQRTFDYAGGGDTGYGTAGLGGEFASEAFTRATFTIAALPDGEARTVSFTHPDSGVIDTFGLVDWPDTTVICSSTSEATARAEYIVLVSSAGGGPYGYAKNLRVYPQATGDQLDAALQSELRDRVTVNVNTGGGVTFDVWCDSISHTIDATNGFWTCDLGFTPAQGFTTIYDPTDLLVMDGTSAGNLDDTRKLGW